MYIRQSLLDTLLRTEFTNKVLIIFGARQIGKTTLIKEYLKQQSNYLLVNGEDINVQQILSSQSIEILKSFVGNVSLLVIDEAQKIPNIGINLKLLVDHCVGLRILVTGSSAFDLANHLGEPLVGRKMTFQLFPLSQIELGQNENLAETKARLENRLLYGSYPEVVLMQDNKKKRDYLLELVSSYLYKDLLSLDGLRKSNKIMQLLQLLAFQIGKEVSLEELSQQLGMNRRTVEHYLDLLEKVFVLIHVKGFSRNLRKEITKSSHCYFYDVGVRNALINQFNALEVRADIGQLWENYVVMERLKKQAYQKIYANNYFWRTYDQQEIDWVEERDAELYGYEIKWKARKAKTPIAWKKAYPDAELVLINQDNYLDFVT